MHWKYIEVVCRLYTLYYLRTLALVVNGGKDTAVHRLMFETDNGIDFLVVLCPDDIHQKIRN
jgi:hypothetical protein